MSSAPSMTTAEYAAHRGVSDSYIRRMRRKGNLVLDDAGNIVPGASDELLDGLTNPVRGGKRQEDTEPAPSPVITAVAAPAVVSVQEAVRRERLARARLAELELGEEARQLTRVAEVNRAVVTLVRQALNRMQAQSSRLRRVLAKETDPHRIAELIDADVADTCKQMRDAAEKLLSGLATATPMSAGAESAQDDDDQPADDEEVADPA